MNKKIIVILCIFLACILTAIAIICINKTNTKNTIADEDKQFDFVFKQYSKIISKVILHDVTIVMDESTYTNFVTGQMYKQDYINRVKGMEITGSENAEIVKIGVRGYNPKSKSVIIYYTIDNNLYESLYKMDVKPLDFLHINFWFKYNVMRYLK